MQQLSLSEKLDLFKLEIDELNQKYNETGKQKFQDELHALWADLERDEVWKPVIIDDKDTGWKVSSLGRVIGKRKSDEPYRPKPQPASGRSVIGINEKIHLLSNIVCLTFHGIKPSDKHTVDHKNDVRSDDRAINLGWATFSENNQNSHDSGTRKSSAPQQSMELMARPNGDTGEGKLYKSIHDFSRKIGLNAGLISKKLAISRSDPNQKWVALNKDWEVRVVDCPDLPGEIWRDALYFRGIKTRKSNQPFKIGITRNGQFIPARVSNKGRWQTPVSGKKYHPEVSQGHRYPAVSCHDKPFSFHIILGATFNDIVPGWDRVQNDKDIKEKWVVDHIKDGLYTGEGLLENLQWMTHAENVQKSLNKPIEYKLEDEDTWTRVDSMKNLASILGVSRTSASKFKIKGKDGRRYDIRRINTFS
jgi:hypothetical protein